MNTDGESHANEMLSSKYEEILDYPYWRHRIDLGDGRVTPGTKSNKNWDRLQLPSDLSGKTVLDIGTFDGLLAFEAERRGADHVVAIDIFSTGGSEQWWFGREPHEDGIVMVKDYLESDIEIRQTNLFSLDPETLGTFDLVICPQVVQLVPDFAGAVERLISITDGTLVIETALPRTISEYDKPVLEFTQAVTDNDNRWWHPTPQLMEALCTSFGCTGVTTEIISLNKAAKSDAVYTQVTSGPTDVWWGNNLDEAVDQLPAGHDVVVLLKHEGAVRIEYRPESGEPLRQGWVQSNMLTESKSGTSSIVARAAQKLRSDGIAATFSAGYRRMGYPFRSDKTGNLLVTVKC